MTSRPLAEAFEEAFQRCRDIDASLSGRLDSLANAVRTLSPPFADAVDRLVTRLQQSGAGETAPQVGEPMPPFHLPDEAGRFVSLDELLSKGPVAVKDGKVKARFVDPDYRKRMAIEGMIAALRSAG